MRLAKPVEFQGKPLKIMIVEDSHFDRENLVRFLTQEGFIADFVHVVYRQQFIEELHSSVDLIICDHKLPDFDSFIAFDLLEESGLDIPFIIISGALSEDRAVQVLKRGAADFLSKNSLSRLTSSIREAIEKKKLRLENQKASAVLKQTQERLQIAMESTELGTWDYSPSDRNLNLCERCISVHGIVSNERVRPVDFIRALDKRDRKEFIADIKLLTRGGKDRNFRINYRLKRDESYENPVWVSLRGKVYFDDILQLERLSGVLIDVSETKWLEEKLRTAVELAENSNRAKSSFLANMSHEIRTPLGAMIGFAEIIRDDPVEPLEQTEFLTSIIGNGKKLLRIVDEILDLSKVERGKLEIEMKNFSLESLLTDLSATMMPIAKAKGIHFLVEPWHLSSDVFFSDEGRIRQVLMNIVGNAIKFTQAGSVTLRLREKPISLGFSVLEFEVEDTGIGISSEQELRLFSPFQQADLSTTRRFGGTGLGLALSRKLCEAMNGELILKKSSLDVGSVFQATIKFRAIKTSELSDPESAVPLQAAVKLDELKILVVDDAMDNQFLINRALERKGAQVSLADNGRQALEILANQDFDIILMDMQMPEMDGLAATRKAREQGIRTPIIALTAHAMLEEKIAAFDAGCQAHVTKPIDFPELFKNILDLARPSSGQQDHLH